MQSKRVFGPAKYFPTTNPSGVTNPPLAVWQFDSPDDWLVDRTVNGRDLSVVTGTFEFLRDEAMGLVGAYFGSGDHELIAPDEEALRIAQDELGTDDASLTLEAIVNPTSYDGAIFDCAGDGESLATNYLWTLGTTWDDAGVRKYWSFLEYGGGANASVSSTAIARLNTLMYLAMTISADGLTFKFYIDGVLVGTGTATHRAEKNSAGGNVQRLRIGRRAADNYDYKGLVCGLRITNETFADADVAEAWDSIKGYSLDQYEPISPAAFADEVKFLPAGGEPKQSDPLTGSTRGRVSSFGVGAFSEEVTFQSEAGGDESHTPLGLTRGRKVAVGASFEENINIVQGSVPEFNNTTLDSDGNNHFIGSFPRAYRAFYYATAGERWHSPTSYSFTGYGRNGRHYTNGVEDPGPVYAPWYSEAPGADRGTRGDFPTRALIVVAAEEICIFDLDTFDGSVSTLKLWMRFRYGNSSNFYMIGRGNETIRDVKMRNGMLVLAQKNTSWENGRLITIDFKGDDTYNTGNLIGSDNHWRWNGTIVQRNEVHYTTSGVSPSLRQNNERVYSVSPWVDENGVTWVALAGEDDIAVVRIPTTGLPAEVTDLAGPDVGDVNLDDEGYRSVMFDRLGLLWFSIGTRLYRNFTFKEGVIVADVSKDAEISGLYRSVDLNGAIVSLAETQNYIFAAVPGVGIYAVHRGSMEVFLAYTPVGGGGVGTLGLGGEIFADKNQLEEKGLYSFSLALANYLAIATTLNGEGEPEATIIRTTDDDTPAVFQFPDLAEPRALFHVIIL